MQRKATVREELAASDDSSIFAQWSRMTAYHGVLDFYVAKGIMAKTAWFTVVIFGCFFAVNQSLGMILEFVTEENWVTTMSTESAPNKALKWPNIMICKIGWSNLRMQELNKRNLRDPYEISYYYGSKEAVSFYDRFQSDVEIYSNKTEFNEKIEQIEKKFNCSDNLTDAENVCVTEIDPLDCKEAIIDCGSGAAAVSPLLDCNCSKYASNNTTALGCFKINATDIIQDKSNYKLNSFGINSGIYLLLNPKLDDYYPNIVYDAELPAAGLRVAIYFDEEEDTALNSPIYLWPNSQIIVSMTLEKHRIKTRKKRSLSFYDTLMPCSSVGKYKWFDTTIPSRRLCQSDCFVQFCMEISNCTIDTSSNYAIVGQKCNDNQENNCLIKNYLMNASTPLLPSGFNLTGCRSECKEPCETETVSTKFTSAQFPAPAQLASYVRFLNRIPSSPNESRPKFNFTENQVAQFILLNIFYAKNEYKLIETVNRGSIDELISDLGGVLGVWTGISLISIYQAVVYLAYGLMSSIKRLRNYLNNRVMTIEINDPVYAK